MSIASIHAIGFLLCLVRRRSQRLFQPVSKQFDAFGVPRIVRFPEIQHVPSLIKMRGLIKMLPVTIKIHLSWWIVAGQPGLLNWIALPPTNMEAMVYQGPKCSACIVVPHTCSERVSHTAQKMAWNANLPDRVKQLLTSLPFGSKDLAGTYSQ